MTTLLDKPLLGDSDPRPVEVVNGESHSPVLLLCEHAGYAIPKKLGSLGVSPEVIKSHRGWDIGAENVAREIAKLLGAPLVVQRYSRLVIDANRPPDGPLAMPFESDEERIPANMNMTAASREARVEEIFDPMNAAITALFDAVPRRACFSIHSFTPVLGGQRRQWHAGFLNRQDLATAQALLETVQKRRPDLTLAVNEPYQILDDTDWFIPEFAEPRELPHALIEIRNDELAEAEGVKAWAALISEAIQNVVETRR